MQARSTAKCRYAPIQTCTCATGNINTPMSRTVHSQAKKNVESSKTIEAQEEVARLRGQVAAAKNKLETERGQKEAMQREMDKLRVCVGEGVKA